MVDGAKELKYDAFISYRHCELDSFVAINLHRKLEKFKIPKSSRALLKEGVSDKIERVFRDEDELPLATNLSDPIELALTNSGHLIVICTPRLKLSSWCQKEIETFIQMHGREKVHLVLAEGEPAESFPEIMTYEEVESTDADGNKVMVRRPLEPLAADVRGKNNKERLKAMDNAVIKLVAAMKGLNYDDVKLRHREQKMKALVRFWSSVSVAIMVFALVCLAMLAKINVQKNEIQDKYAYSMANASQDLLDIGRREDALYVARRVLPKNGDYNSESYRMLVTSVSPYSAGESYIPTKLFKSQTFISDYMVSKNGRFLAMCASNSVVTIFDTETGEELTVLDVRYENNGFPHCDFDNEKGFIYKNEDGMMYYNLITGQAKLLCEEHGYVLAGAECDAVDIFTGDYIYGYRDGNQIYETDLYELGIDTSPYYDYDYGYSEDGKYMAIAMRGYDKDVLVFSMDTNSGTVVSAVKLKIDGALCVAVNETYIYLSSMTAEENKSELYIIDTNSVEVYGSIELPISFIKEIKMVDGKVFLISSNDALLLDAYSFETIATAEECSIIMNGFVNENKTYVVDYTGRVFEISRNYPYGVDCSASMFDITTKGDVANVQSVGGKIFYEFFDSNYVVMYEDNPDNNSVLISYENSEDKRFESKMLEEEKYQNFKDVKTQYIGFGQYSSDGKLIMLTMLDGSVRIYDAKRYKHLKTLYSFDGDTSGPLVYIKEDNIYILDDYPHAYILNEDLEIISNLDYVAGYEDHNFIVEASGSGQYYKVPYVSYREMIKRADKMLGNYKPDEEIFEKYGMMK